MASVVEGFSDPADRGRAIFERLRGDVATDEVEAAPVPPLDDAPAEPSRPVLYDDEAADAADLAEQPVPVAPEVAVPRETPPEADAADAPVPGAIQLPTPTADELELPEPPMTTSAVPAAPEQPETPPSPFLRPLPRVMAVANQKGGVGKTTTAVNLGACLAELGYRVLVCDLDPQGNASTGLGLNPRNMQTSMYDVILNDVPLEDCVEPTSVRNLFVAPASLDLAGAEIELVPAFSRELRLKRAIEAAADDYDFVLIDCPPSLGLLTVNGLAAATEVVVPIQCEYYALEGLGQLLRNVALVQKNLNPTLEVSAIICVMYDARTKLSDQVVQEVRTHFGDKVCRNVVPRTVRLSEAPSFGQPIIAFDPTSRGAIAYRELAKEVSGGAPIRTR
ncbi:MAG: ATPase involved in chromosome partitioning [Actinomycetia bacterium]|nr:ATPase involved in chromosome partitioning [Actinomycetes bacterium]